MTKCSTNWKTNDNAPTRVIAASHLQQDSPETLAVSRQGLVEMKMRSPRISE
jgi:hypothetical protein